MTSAPTTSPPRPATGPGEDGRASGGKGAGSRSPSRRPRPGLRLLGIAAVLLIGGLALVRFATAGGGSGSDPAPASAPAPARAASPTEHVAALERAVETDPEDLESWQGLARAYLDRAVETGDPGWYELSDRAVTTALDLGPDDPVTTTVAGALALARHEFADALRLGQEAAVADPSSDEALLVVVDAQVELGRYDDAAATLQQIFDLRPSLAALARLSYLRQLDGDVTGAVLAMQQAEEAGTGVPFDQATVATYLGDLRLATGDPDMARAAYERALQRSPGLVLAELGLARVEAITGLHDAAIERLVALTDRYPLPAALVLLGDLQFLTGDTIAAETTYEVARAAHGSVSAAGGVIDLELALFEADRGNAGAALDLATAAHRSRRTVYTADAMAWALFVAGRSAEAVPYAEEAVGRATADPLVHYHAAEVLAAAGETGRARDELAAAFDLSPRFSPLHDERAQVLAGQLGLSTP